MLESINGANPGGSLSLSRSTTITASTGAPSLSVGTNLRDLNNPNLTALPGIVGTKVAFPIALGSADATNAFNPNIKTGQVKSYSFGYQREIDRNTVVEVRYVGNKGSKLQRQYNLNEFRTALTMNSSLRKQTCTRTSLTGFPLVVSPIVAPERERRRCRSCCRILPTLGVRPIWQQQHW